MASKSGVKRKLSTSDKDSGIESDKKLYLPDNPGNLALSKAHNSAVAEFVDVLDELECCLPQDAGGSNVVVKASSLLLSIKTLQRQLLDRLQNESAKMEARRVDLHKQTLALEALKYESSHLQIQLKAYTNFLTPNLEKMAREEVPDTECSSTTDIINLFLCGSVEKSHEEPNQHEAIMQKLHKEINARGNLERDVKLAQKKLDERKRVFSDKETFMAQLPKKLEKMEQASLPLQQFFKVATDSDTVELLTSDRRKRLDLAKSLPGPLYTLFIQLQAHMDATNGGANGTTVQVLTKGNGASNCDPMISKNYVQLTFQLPDIAGKDGASAKQATMSVDFVYYPVLKVVTAKATGIADKINADAVLDNLFPGDDGSFTLVNVGDTETTRRMEGKPYSWCNYMAGLHLATPWGDSSSRTLCTKVIVAELSKRVRADATLTQLVFSFANKKIAPVHPSMVEHISVDPATLAKIHSFVEHKREQTKGNELCYQVTIKRRGATLRATVTLDPSRYPSMPPKWSLMTGEGEWGELHGSATSLDNGTNPLYDNTLGSIETFVNANVIELVNQRDIETHDWVLSHQLQTIIGMWDQAQKAAEQGQFQQERSIKGRDRS